jgi:hypothetical protein
MNDIDLTRTIRAKCASCHRFAWANPQQQDSTCACGKLKIISCEVIEGDSEPFKHEEFVAAMDQIK